MLRDTETFINARDSRSLLLPRPTTMVELNKAQRAVLVDTLPDAANLAVGALFFAQFLSERAFSSYVALAGLALWVLLVGFAVRLAAGTES